MSTTSHPTNGYARSPLQKVALLYGVVFLIVGVGGFIPGLTTDIEGLQFAGHGSGAMLLGIFQVSILHNVVHLLYGVVGLLAARAFGFSRQYLIWGGAVYALLWLYGLLVPHDHGANFVPLNTADNWLHFALAVTMIGFGVLLGRRAVAAAR
ncbi:DUF4383 domain-containing protein [Microbacterium marinilacus]|uniref:DUF4383 domain-containing protein n=1 Tax=Microbacterium marinilacus TaxID=415209 RepID=A0ABP7BNB0_9MICO|nr:DUF4383 domain-containing protein [Microbacterium marinilacus]MBY0688310.1 DUF4383 domain-containing protein [Microbacterium marinilacus]